MDIQLNVSYLEIYNENLIDLLDPQENKSLEIREHPQKGIIIPDLTEQGIINEQEG